MNSQGEYIGALILTILGSALSILSVGYGVLSEGARVGPGFVPFVSGLLLALFGISIGWEKWRERATSNDDTPVDVQDTQEGEQNTTISVALIFGMLLIAVMMAPIIGFLPSFSLLVFGILVGIEREKLWLSLLMSIGIGIAAWLIFFEFMGIHLPVGIITLAGG